MLSGRTLKSETLSGRSIDFPSESIVWSCNVAGYDRQNTKFIPLRAAVLKMKNMNQIAQYLLEYMRM